MTGGWVEVKKIAKAVIATTGTLATAALAYPDLIPLPAQWRASLATGAVFVTGVATWFVRNAPAIEAVAGTVDSAVSNVWATPELQQWARSLEAALADAFPDVVTDGPVLAAQVTISSPPTTV